MSYIQTTYLIISDKKFDTEQRAKEIVRDTYIWNEKIFPYDTSRLKNFEIKILDYFDFKAEDTGEYRAIIKIGYPSIIFTPSVASIISILFGRISLYGRIRLVDIDFPLPFLDMFKGANYGIEGVRKKLNIFHEPLLMVTLETHALKSDEIADLFYKIGTAGADIVKENDTYYDDNLAPFEERIKAVLEKKKKAEDFTGKKIIYAPVLTGKPEKILEKAEKAYRLGVEAFIIDVVPYGFELIQKLTETVEAIFIGNPSFTGSLYQCKDYGIEAHLLFGKFLRLAGIDIAIFPSPYGDYPLIHHHAMEVSEALRQPLGNLKPIFPAPSLGIYPEIVPQIFKDFGNQVVINVEEIPYLHKDGVEAGVKAFRDIIDCTVNGVSIEDCRSVSEQLDKFIKEK